jgi:hypothetical protein
VGQEGYIVYIGAGWAMHPLFGVIVASAGGVFSCLWVYSCIETGSVFIGRGRVGDGGRSIVIVFGFGAVLWGKRVILLSMSWHACCRPGIRMFCRRLWWR